MKLAGPSPPPPEEEQPITSDAAAGTGRLYECVFCKRGFNTAQALGGHMNIHRKDGTRNSRVLHVSAAHRNPPSESTPTHHLHRLPQQPPSSYSQSKRAGNHGSGGGGGLDLELRLGYLHHVEEDNNSRFIHNNEK